MSLRTRLLAGMVVLVAAGLGLAALVTYEEQRSFLLTRVHQQVLAALGPMSGALRLDGRGPRAGFREPQPALAPFTRSGLTGRRPLAVLPPGTFGEVRGPTGAALRRRTFSYDGTIAPTPRLPAHIPISRAGASPRLFTFGAGSDRYEAVAFASGGDTAVVAVPLREADQTLHRLIVVEALVGGGIIVALMVLGWIVMGVGLRPLERMRRTASEIAEGDLSQRVSPSDHRTEVGRLGRSLNDMLAQIERAFDDRRLSEQRLRHFLADASHELRTPLASIRGYAELFRMGAADDAATLERAMTRIEAESARMGVLVEDLLLLAQLDQHPEPRRDTVELAELLGHAVDDTRVVTPDRTIVLEIESPATVLGDADRLRQLIANLLRNAVIHTPEGSPIECALRREPGRAVIEIRDHGPGLPAGAGELVFERFWRSEGGRRRGRGGAGLGLAIVHGIAVAHGGEVQSGNAPSGGARFRVHLPLAGSSALTTPADDAAVEFSAQSQLSPG